MRVLMVTSSYPKYPGDVTAPFIEMIAKGVADRGHEVDVVLPFHPELRRGSDEPVRFFPYRYAPKDSWSLWGYAQSLERDVRVRKAVYMLAPLVAFALRETLGARLVARRYDTVHVHWVVPNAVLVDDMVKAHGVPLVVSLHGSDVFLAETMPLLRGAASRTLFAAGAVTACSGDLGQRAVALGARSQRTRTVPYGVDVAEFAPEKASPSIRARLGVAPETFLVLAVGRLVEKKGFTYLVEAAAKTGGIHVVIAGEGDLRTALEAQARALQAPVTFTGALDRATVAAALAAADAVVVPSIVDAAGNVDGLPNSLLEALAAGRPVVASRVAGIPDVVDDEDNGLLVPEKNPGAIAAALRRLVRETETAARLGRRARERAVVALSWQAVARSFEDCYAQAAALDAR
jgi:glycosyltransferase involved in cell wall biosynthesis